MRGGVHAAQAAPRGSREEVEGRAGDPGLYCLVGGGVARAQLLRTDVQHTTLVLLDPTTGRGLTRRSHGNHTALSELWPGGTGVCVEGRPGGAWHQHQAAVGLGLHLSIAHWRF